MDIETFPQAEITMYFQEKAFLRQHFLEFIAKIKILINTKLFLIFLFGVSLGGSISPPRNKSDIMGRVL